MAQAKGRKPNKTPSVIYKPTLSLHPVKHAALIAVLESIPKRQLSATIVDMLTGKIAVSVGGQALPIETHHEEAVEIVDVSDDGW